MGEYNQFHFIKEKNDGQLKGFKVKDGDVTMFKRRLAVVDRDNSLKKIKKK